MTEYMDSLVANQPLDTDPQEKEIKQKLDRVIMSGEFARAVIPMLKEMQSSFFEFSFNNLDNEQLIMRRYRELITELRIASNVKIVAGEEQLSKLEVNKSCIIATNHLGLIKLMPIENPNHKYPIPVDKFEPFPLRHAPLSMLSDKLDANLYETAVQLPGSLSQIQEACGVIIITPNSGGQTNRIIEKVKLLLRKNPRPIAIVMYPEGGTSGKRNHGGPYSLDSFHTGTFVIAAKVGLPVLPVAQVFNPLSGYELSVFPPIKLSVDKLGGVNAITENVKSIMQSSLDKLIIPK